MDNDKNFGENEMNDMLKKFNQKNKKEDDEDQNFIISKVYQENNINNSISSCNQQIISYQNEIKLLKIKLQEKDDIIKKKEKMNKQLEKEKKQLEKEIKKLKDQFNKYGVNKNKITDIKPKIKNKTEIYNQFEIINIEENINNNYFLNNDQQNCKYNENNNMISNFKENNNFINLNQNIGNDYSFECLSKSGKLTKNIIENKSESVTFNLELKNNGSLPWPKGETKLIFENTDFGKENFEDIILEPQEKDKQKSYTVIFQELKEYPIGEYTSNLRFNVNGKNIGEEIVLKIIIEEEKYDFENLKKEMGDNVNELSKFEEEYYDAIVNK